MAHMRCLEILCKSSFAMKYTSKHVLMKQKINTTTILCFNRQLIAIQNYKNQQFHNDNQFFFSLDLLQCFIYPPFFWTRDNNLLSTKLVRFLIMSLLTLFAAFFTAFHSSSLELYCLLQTYTSCLTINYRFSTGFKSGEYGGHSISLLSLMLRFISPAVVYREAR